VQRRYHIGGSARFECRQVAAGSLPRSDVKSRRLRRV